jgi:hypothetical protein
MVRRIQSAQVSSAARGRDFELITGSVSLARA